MKNLSSLEKFSFSNKEMKKIKGGLLGIFCITGVLDGIPNNTKFNWGRCKSNSMQDITYP